MQIHRAYLFELFPDEEQAVLMSRTAGSSRFLYNLALEQRSLLYSQWRKGISCQEQDRELTLLKKEVPWLKEVPAQPLQQALRDLDRAFQRFFQGLSGYPQFKRKHKHDSFRYPQVKPEHVTATHIFLPKIGWVRVGEGRHRHQVEGEVRHITVKRRNGHWTASVTCEVEVPEPKPVLGPAIGIDRGVAITCALSDGRTFQTPQFTEGEEKHFRRLQRQLSRQEKGSNNRRKTLKKLQEMRWRLHWRRLDAIHHFTTAIAKNQGLVVLEGLDVQRMTGSAKGTKEKPGRRVRQKAGLNRAILQSLWGEIGRQLEYKAAWYGSRVVKVPAAYTSQTCIQCGHIDRENRIRQDEFCCQRCGMRMNADLNAANVILALGLGVYACAGAAEGMAARQESVVQGTLLRSAA